MLQGRTSWRCPPAVQYSTKQSSSTAKSSAAQHKIVGTSRTAQHCMACDDAVQLQGTAQHGTVQHRGGLHAQHDSAQHSTAQHSTAQHSTAQHSNFEIPSPALHFSPDFRQRVCIGLLLLQCGFSWVVNNKHAPENSCSKPDHNSLNGKYAGIAAEQHSSVCVCGPDAA